MDIVANLAIGKSKADSPVDEVGDQQAMFHVKEWGDDSPAIMMGNTLSQMVAFSMRSSWLLFFGWNRKLLVFEFSHMVNCKIFWTSTPGRHAESRDHQVAWFSFWNDPAVLSLVGRPLLPLFFVNMN